MVVPYIHVPKLIGNFIHQQDVPNTYAEQTVKKLREICKSRHLKQAGLKANIVKRLTSAENRTKPYWFFWDESVGQGAHALFYVCRCGAAVPMNKFNVRDDGLVFPSIDCDQCAWHIWARMTDWTEKDWPKGYIHPFRQNEYYHPKHGYRVPKALKPGK